MNNAIITDFIPVRKSQVPLYFNTPLYKHTGNGEFVIHKPAGQKIAVDGKYTGLFISASDRLSSIQELQGQFSSHLKSVIKTDNVEEIKGTLVNLVSETLAEPRSGTLDVLPDTVDMVVDSFSERPDIIKSIFLMSTKDYTTAMHAVNVMALTIGFCNFKKMSSEETNRLALMALLHDVGKTEIPSDILKAHRKLTVEEFEVMRSHPRIGADIILNDPVIDDEVAVGALQHHERLDGSGYPYGLTDISFEGKLLGIVDCYEALTTDERPYRRSQPPLEVLNILKEDAKVGKLDWEIFKSFCLTLCTM